MNKGRSSNVTVNKLCKKLGIKVVKGRPYHPQTQGKVERVHRSFRKKLIYYIDKSVLVENRPLLKFIRNYVRDSSGVFSISSLVRISMTSYPALTLLFVQNTLVHLIKRKLHGGLKIPILFSRGKKQ